MISTTDRIAIVGLGLRFPGAGADPGRFWQDVASAVDRSADVPAGRWFLPPDRCLDPRIANPDTVYSARGYYLDPFEPDLTGLNIDPRLVSRLDPLFHIILDAGGRAWRSAKTDPVDRSRVGVVLGNICLPTQSSNALCREYLGRRLLSQATESGHRTHKLNRFVAGLPAGVLAKALGLGGGSYTLDAACASSLYAIKLAADELLAGRADAMLAGGANGSDPQYTQMGFSQLRALSPSGRCSPFDQRADGLMVGEGAGIFVLKRLADAIQHGDKILAVLAGAGLSNDMHGNLLAPAKEGQLRAMRRAYERAGWKPQDVDLIECHATGTPVGDAVEFESLREMWDDAAGKCVIGSVKSTVGHLLTGAGAAAVAKVVLAMANETLPPQANFETPAAGLRYADGPFRVLNRAEPWKRRRAGEPRRAAVSGFGFGGVNAHLLLEEWTDAQATIAHIRPSAEAIPVAVVGMSAHFGPWEDLRAFQERVLGSDDTQPAPKHNGWGLADKPCPPGFYIEDLHFPIDRFRVPPKELQETLPQQLLMLRVAAAALDDCLASGGRKPPVADTADDPNTGVFIGLGLDPNTTNFHLRWSVLAQELAVSSPEAGKATTAHLIPDSHLLSPDLASPPLTANRTMGALGSIAASRIARAFHIGGPSHTVCSEEASAARAVELAVRALQAKEIDRALVGGVDLAGDPRLVLPGKVKLPGEGAAAVVLKRLADAERDGDRIYAVIRGVGVASEIERAVSRACDEGGASFDTVAYLDGPDGPTPSPQREFPLTTGWADRDIGHAGAASAAAGLVKTCLAIYQEIIPALREGEAPAEPSSRSGLGGSLALPKSPRYWLHDRIDSPRRAAVTASGTDGSCLAILLEEYAKNTEPTRNPERLQPLGARSEALFVADGGSPAELVGELGRLREFIESNRGHPIESLARGWLQEALPKAGRVLAVATVARSAEELLEQVAFAAQSVRSDPSRTLPGTLENGPRPAIRDRVFYTLKPLGPKAKLALVFPGSGNQFDGMGRDLGSHWPEVLRRQQTENQLLRSQFAPDFFWNDRTAEATPRDLMFGQVTVGALVSDILLSLGVKPDGVVGLSLGESAGLFAARAWRSRDEMYLRMRASSLFNSDLAPPYDAARRHWNLPPEKPAEWVSGVIAASADDVVAALRPGLKAYLLIINTPNECVIGGRPKDVEKLARAVGQTLLPLTGVTIAHCEAGRRVEAAYRELHTLPVTAPRGITFYSGAWGRGYPVSEQSAADSITGGLLNPIDVPAVVTAAYEDGVRVFIEVGPGASCTRLIDTILGDRPHLARAAHAARQDAVSQLLRLVANLIAEGIPVDLDALYDRETHCVGHRSPVAKRGLELVIPVGQQPPVGLRELPGVAVEPTPKSASGLSFPELVPTLPPTPESPAVPVEEVPESVSDTQYSVPSTEYSVPLVAPPPEPRATPAAVAFSDTALSLQAVPAIAPIIEAAANVRTEIMRAEEVFLRLNRQFTETAAGVLRFQAELIERWERTDAGRAGDVSPLFLKQTPSEQDDNRGLTPPAPQDPPRSLTYEQCCAFAAGKVADALGPLFAEVDTFPTRVRLPDGPLQLVDQITRIEGEPLSMTRGRVVTTHTIQPDRWYLEADRIPTAISVEAGQADLFLSGFLGIDFQTRGLAVYRLLDAVVSFHRGLPRLGETVIYDIHIDEFVKQGDAWIFRFWFDGTVNGEPFITMRNGVAGFFTAEALAVGKGIVQTALDRQRLAGKRPADWRELVPQQECSLDRAQVAALRRGDLVAAFGPEFAAANLCHPAPLPGGMLRLVDRVPLIDPVGGRFGIGFVRAEFDIHPDDWFLTCHFVDDMVMPGTLMYECCLHTLRIFLMRMGWVGEAGEVVCEPVPGVNSRLKCRGQVIATTKTVTYEVTVKELGFRPEPYCIADALMYADGKPIVEITNMCLRMTGLTREKLEATWTTQRPGTAVPGLPLYDSASILAFSNGNPSDALGEPYRVFDSDRVIARLPGPPFQFLDCVTAVTGEPFVLKAGAACETQYDVPRDAWYFEENRSELMPFSVLLEIALQPCGWLAAYCGSALTSPEDLKFRNLGGKAIQLRPVTPDTGTLTVNAMMTNVSRSAGMIIQHFDMRVSDRSGTVYEGTTYFGFFSKGQLANQIGIREAKVPWPGGQDMARAERGELPHEPPFPAPMMRMIDRIEAYIPDGGSKGLGLVVGRIAVDPGAWFFQAHFYQDPVWPGSLGLESFLQLLKFAAWKRWGRTNPVTNVAGSPNHSAARSPGEPATLVTGYGRGYQTVALNRPHAWSYRGQVIPSDKEVTVLLEVTEVDEANRRLTANGFLTVDGRVIYQMTDFTLE